MWTQGRRGEHSPVSLQEAGAWPQSPIGGRREGHLQERASGRSAKEGCLLCSLGACDQIATIVSNPGLMTTLFLLQGKVLIISARPSPNAAARSTPLSPPMLHPEGRNHHFPILPLSQALSLLSGLEAPDTKENPLSPFSPCVPTFLWVALLYCCRSQQAFSAEPASWLGCLFWVSRFLGVFTLCGF